MLDKLLEGKKFITGDEPTLADISLFSSYVMFKTVYTDIEATPAIDAWFERCKSLPGADENLAAIDVIQKLMAAKGSKPVSLNR